MHFQTPSAIEVEEITVQDAKRQDFEWNLTRSNWRFFMAMQQEQPESSPVGSDRRDQAGRKSSDKN